jgi:hypothetical protein
LSLDEQSRKLMQGSYDLHIHSAPSHFPRALNDLEALRQANDWGMAGVLLKSHYEPTASRAALVNLEVGGAAQAYGGITLNWPVGGLNPYAVASALRLGAKIVWMPTRDAVHSLKFGDMPGDFFQRPGLSILAENGQLLPVVADILEVVKAYDACIASGHLSPEESYRLCLAARAKGVKTILTHPDWGRTVIPLETQMELAAKGVFIEKVWANIKEKTITAPQMAASMRQLGADRVFMVTDRGQQGEELPAPELAKFIAAMLQQGLSAADIRTMVTEVPALLLDCR